MKHHHQTIVVFLFCLVVSFAAFGFISPEQLKKDMGDKNPETRAAAMKDFVVSISSVYGKVPLDDDSVSLLITGLGDSSVDVRRSAALGLLQISAMTSPVLRSRTNVPLDPNKPDLLKNKLAQPALLNAIADPDAQVRRTAMATYSASYKLTPYVESKILRELNSGEAYPNGAPIRDEALQESLMVSGSASPAATAYFLKLLNDPKYEWKVIDRIGADSCPLSSEVLTKLANMLSKETDEGHREEIVSAIAAYGAAAKPYLPVLRQMLTKQPSGELGIELQSAIKRISESAL